MYSLFICEFGCILSPGAGIAPSVVALLNCICLAPDPQLTSFLTSRSCKSIRLVIKTPRYKGQSKNWQHGQPFEMHAACMLPFLNRVNAATSRNFKIQPNSLITQIKQKLRVPHGWIQVSLKRRKFSFIDWCMYDDDDDDAELWSLNIVWLNNS